MVQVDVFLGYGLEASLPVAALGAGDNMYWPAIISSHDVVHVIALGPLSNDRIISAA